MKMAIGIRLKEILKQKKMTVKQLSENSGVSENTLYGIIKRDNKTINPDIATKITTALEIKIADLMGISDYINSVENEIRQATNFYDYLASLGYIILEIEHEESSTIYLKTSDKDIELNLDDIKLLKELEDSTGKDIKRTIELLIATKK